MSNATTFVVRSDPTLLADVRRYGRFDTSACYQCGSCTISCDLVTDYVSFPRRTIRYTLLGLRGPLLGSLEPWICHDCGDCSIICPRQAGPRLSMMTVRRFLTAQYDWTGISSKLLQSRVWYIGSLSFVALVVVALIFFYHLSYVGLPLADFVAMPFGMEHMFPIMTYFTLTVLLLPMFLLVSRIWRIWRLTMGGEGRVPIAFSAYVAEAWTYVRHSVTHSLMRKCPERGRWLGHWLLAAGTVLMLTIKLFGLRWFQTDSIYAFYHPQRWLGYIATAFILYGIGSIIVGRVRAQKEFYKETQFEDVIFPILLLLTALSGIAVHILRYAGFALSCHFAFALHVIIATPMLLVEMSFGKWSHMIYRPLALYFEAVKERSGQRTPAKEAAGYAL
ncbi:MAG: 4Fe-4S dicluster domain-containing protein [Acidobacteria bacterium]|nr:4Fe-4S dicluster domain-containing protein [Acidobacteriota bacterium]MCL5288055.1 4Fe-4S dicluster domain-containing protein [Acidobacteriota bacterium]